MSGTNTGNRHEQQNPFSNSAISLFIYTVTLLKKKIYI